ncbi:Zinc carboxypeptidase [Bryocella elongata]|uniref:Zinc carboxypeptidase n=1 Tax=Bryocella elongata TaxID=863522 RepID=A0A1H5XUC8_9BACT|nr:M14 metallopeptidase family protein [Bryocella elongata]SEG15253.1 Zinc carboxypeptidase [Bryocella elongata]
MSLLRRLRPLCLLPVLLASHPALHAQAPTPVSVLGHTPGDDFYLATYEDAVKYFHTLSASTDRMKMFTVGKTTQGRDIEVAVISSPANLAKLDEYKKNARKLATADGLDDASALALARQSKVIVHIDGGLHSSEVAGGQHSITLAYKLVSAKNDPEIDAILDNVILVLWPTLNPDGQDMIVNWYRKNVGTKYEVAPLPWLYQEYVGHDNNRDGFMLNMKEEQVVTKTEIEYSPDIFYCQHQTAPFPARIWIPPFADPISGNISPYVRSWLNVLGTNMTAYLDQHNMPGAISETHFDNWYAGFTDWAGVYRGEISFFTETALYRYATPRLYTVDEFPTEYNDLRVLSMYTAPWVGGWWRLKDAVDYMVAGSMSVLDLAAKNHEALQYNRYQTARDNKRRTEPPFAYVISSKQADVPEAGLLAQKMIDNGLDVYQTNAGFEANGIAYPAGSWVVPMDQAFAPMAKELMERQAYPAAATGETASGSHLPYDITGWTLPLQMGVAVDTVSDPLEATQRAKMSKVDAVKLPEAGVSGAGETFAISHKPNNAFQIVNAVLAKGGSVSMASEPLKTAEGNERGAFLVKGIDHAAISDLTSKYGVGAVAMASAPEKTVALKKARVGLYRPWTGAIDEGWTRWILENYNYGAKSLYNADIRSANLRDRYDVIILPDINSNQLMHGFREGMVPGQYAGGIEESGAENLREFVRSGGTLIAFNQAASALIPVMSLPVKNIVQGLPNDKFYCSGALLRIEVQHPELPINFGVPSSPVVMFERGPAFEIQPGFKGAVLAKYAKQGELLESGLIIHQELLHDKVAALEVSYGKGRVFLYGFKPQHRGQAHGTYRYLFNALYQFEDPPMPVETPTPAPPARAAGETSAGSEAAAPAAAGAARRTGQGAQP